MDWIIEHAAPFFSIVILAAALSAAAAWLVLQTRYAKQLHQLAEYEDKLGGATPDEARRRIESLQARVARLEPRRLTRAQKAMLQKLLPLPEKAGLTEISVAHDAAHADCAPYATDFVEVLRACPGWQPSSVTLFGAGHQTQWGLAIVSFPRGRTAAGGKLLSKALAAAQIEHETIHSDQEQLELVITSRPPPRDEDLDDAIDLSFLD